MDTGLALDPGMSTGLALDNQDIGFGTCNVTGRATHTQDIPPPPTPGLSDNLAYMRLSAQFLKGGKSKPAQISHPQPTQRDVNVPADECICSARCEIVHRAGATEHEFCSVLRVGNGKAKARNIFGVNIVSQ